MSSSNAVDFFGPPISIYTRRQAIQDGVLVDVTAAAAEAGIACPVAITRAVWARYVVPDDYSRMLGQSEQGRLWDIVFLLWHAALRVGPQRNQLHLPVAFVMHGDRTEMVILKAVAGGGDHGEWVLTVMMPDED
jgi:hypothetical protein